MNHAFADESFRKREYLICAATVATSDLQETRKTLRGLCLRGQRRLHFVTESDSRRKVILSAIAELNLSTSVYVAPSRDQTSARRVILKAMVNRLRSDGVTRLVLDARQGQDQRDRNIIHALVQSHPKPQFEYAHLLSESEAILWIPDAVAWVWGRGGQWRKRAEGLGLISDVTTVEVP